MKNNLEENRLIAEFMNIKPKMESPDVYYYSDLPYFSTREYNPEKVMENFSKYAKYNTSWDWLMPVIEKIEKLGYDTEIVYRLDDGGHCFYINDSPIFSSQIGGKLEAVYKATVEFIKWYDKNCIEKTDQQQNRDLGQSTII